MAQRPLQNHSHPIQTVLPTNNPTEAYPHDQNNDQSLSLEEIEQILGEEGTVLSRKETILVLKINQLLGRCSRLALTNRHLSKQIQDLQQDVYGQGQVQINESIAQQFLQSVELHLQEYRSHFEDYRARQQIQMQAKDAQIDGMGQQLAELTRRLQLAELQRAQADSSNQQLARENQQLREEIDGLQERVQLQGRRGKGYGRKGKGESEVQAELESLIEKLVDELQAERKHKKRLNQQIKRMQQEMLEMQRDIALRNNKIYTLEMQALRANRPNQNSQTSPSNHNSPPNTNNHINNYTSTHKSPNRSYAQQKAASSQVKNFSLMQLMNEEIQISEQARVILGSKVVDYYIRKLSGKDYSTLMLEDILICNFHHVDPQLSFIRRNKLNSDDPGELTRERLVWNLAFILDNLINHRQDRQRGESYPELAQLINSILEETTAAVEDVYNLKQLLAEALERQY